MDAIVALERAVDYMEAHLTDPLDMEQIARQAYLSGYYFQRVFAMVMGMSVGEYIRGRRLWLAYGQMLDTDQSLTDIALAYGYDTPEGFARAFRRQYGVTPSEARRQRLSLASFERTTVLDHLSGGIYPMENLTKRGYTVEENGALYYTEDMDKTAEWFTDVLGWYVGIESRDTAGRGTYGCATPVPGELINIGVAQFHGFHLFVGEPAKRRVGFILVKGVDRLREYVLKKGWTQVSDVRVEPWQARACDVTTPDGSVITFFET